MKSSVLVMALGEFVILILSSSWTKASIGMPDSVKASKISVPRAFHVMIDRSIWGLSGRGVASALVAGPWNWMGGRKDKVPRGCTLVVWIGKSRV